MALGSLVQSTGLTTSLKKIFKDELTTVEDVAILTAESWVRASSIAELCPREEVIVSAKKLQRKRQIDADFHLILEHGKALHHQLQNSILPGLGLLLGEWACLGCGKHYGVQDNTVPIAKWAMPRPSQCSCKGRDFQYVEATFANNEYRLTGHNDGFLRINGMPGLGILEAKSIGDMVWKVKAAPQINHVVQCQIYMWLSDLKWAKILYWHKGGQGLGALYEHTLERDEEMIAKIKETIQSIWDGIKTGILPERICVSRDAPRADSCIACKPCFEE
jgi:hypothetical protein